MEIERFGDRDILLTFQEAAQILRVSRATLYRLLGSGQLVGHKVGRGWRFYKTDIHAFVAAQSSPRSQPSNVEPAAPQAPRP